jgi:hypothetical protein
MRNHNFSCFPGRVQRFATVELSCTLKIPNSRALTIPPSLPVQADEVIPG